MEIWKEISGYNSMYLISDLGRVKSLKNGQENILKQSILPTGYAQVGLFNVKCYSSLVHKLVAEYFLGHTSKGYDFVVDHIDNDKLNNKATNLQIITVRENTSKDKYGHSSDFIGVSFCKKSKKYKSIIQIEGKLRFIGYFLNEINASEKYQEVLRVIKKDGSLAAINHIESNRKISKPRFKGVYGNSSGINYFYKVTVNGSIYKKGGFKTEHEAYMARRNFKIKLIKQLK